MSRTAVNLEVVADTCIATMSGAKSGSASGPHPAQISRGIGELLSMTKMEASGVTLRDSADVARSSFLLPLQLNFGATLTRNRLLEDHTRRNRSRSSTQ